MLLPVLFTLEGCSLLLAKDIFSGRNQTITSGGGESGRKFSRSKPSCDWRGRSEGAGTEKATKTAEADQDHATVSPFPPFPLGGRPVEFFNDMDGWGP